MSNNWALKSTGKPYLAFVQESLAYMDAASMTAGPSSLQLDFAVDSLPEQYASADEVHPLFSFHESVNFGGATLLALGVTPSGRVTLLTPAGGSVSTSTGFVTAGGGFRSIRGFYYTDGINYYAKILELVGGGLVVVAQSAIIPTGSTKPSGSLYARVVIGNGLSELTKFRYRIREAMLIRGSGTIFTPIGDSVLWRVDEGGGPLLHGVVVPGVSHDPNLDLPIWTLTARPWVYPWRTFPANAPWPDPPAASVDLGDYYGWAVSTAYTRLAPPVTRFTRTQA